jgi:hypothetical protein
MIALPLVAKDNLTHSDVLLSHFSAGGKHFVDYYAGWGVV